MKIKLISILVRYCHVIITLNLGLLKNEAFQIAFEKGRINRLDYRYKRTAIKTVLFCLSVTSVNAGHVLLILFSIFLHVFHGLLLLILILFIAFERMDFHYCVTSSCSLLRYNFYMSEVGSVFYFYHDIFIPSLSSWFYFSCF